MKLHNIAHGARGKLVTSGNDFMSNIYENKDKETIDFLSSTTKLIYIYNLYNMMCYTERTDTTFTHNFS